MNETKKDAIEAELALREKILAFKKKEQEFAREAWRRIGILSGVGFTLFLCAAIVAFGGWKIHTMLENGTIQEVAKSCKNVSPAKVEDHKSESKTMSTSVSANSTNVAHTDTQTTSLLKSESQTCPHSWSFNVALIMNGALVLSGLGVTTFLGIRLVGERE